MQKNSLLPHRNTKIIATLGPASDGIVNIEALARAGVNVFRLNFSHGTHADHQARYLAIREVEAKLSTPLAVLQDLQGPKIRLGVFAGGPQTLTPGQIFTLDLKAENGGAQRVTLPHPEVFAALRVNDDLLIDDGKLRLRVTACDSTQATMIVVVGGIISDRKGVNLPDTRLNQSVLTPKDRNDLAFGLALGVDWVAQSFVQHADDIRELRALVQRRASIVAKLEKPLAIAHLIEIVRETDAVMVARGDLGVEVPAEDVPILQRRIVRACREAGKPVIVATQMLESMIVSPVPTRAEASDVATAVYDGVDAVMLSAESASGAHPLAAVEMMDKIIRAVEADPLHRDTVTTIRPRCMDRTHSQSSTIDAVGAIGVTEAIGAAINTIADMVPLTATMTYTTSGASALRVAHERPGVPIVGLTPIATTARKLALVWGVRPRVSPDARNVEEMVHIAINAAHDMGLTQPGLPIAIVAGMPFGTPGSTNLLRLAWPDTYPEDNSVRRLRDPYFELASTK